MKINSAAARKITLGFGQEIVSANASQTRQKTMCYVPLRTTDSVLSSIRRRPLIWAIGFQFEQNMTVAVVFLQA